MNEPGYHDALRILCQDAGATCTVCSRRRRAGTGPDPVVYLADFARQVLLPLAAGVPSSRYGHDGRPGLHHRPAGAAGDGTAAPVWVPVLEQTARIGVLAVAVGDPSPEAVRQAELLGVFAGLVVTGLAQVSDAPRVLRRGGRMSLPASMQWDLLPPWALRVPRARKRPGCSSRRTTSRATRSTTRLNGPCCISRSSTAWGTASARRS